MPHRVLTDSISSASATTFNDGTVTRISTQEPPTITGLALDATTGVISRTPTATGASTFTIAATNICGTDTHSTTLTIAATATTPPMAPQTPTELASDRRESPAYHLESAAIFSPSAS